MKPEHIKILKHKFELSFGQVHFKATGKRLKTSTSIEGEVYSGGRVKMVLLGLEDAERLGKATHCDICSEPLDIQERRMQSHNHRECWRKWVEEKRAAEPVQEEELV